jgi:hypothetical protein
VLIFLVRAHRELVGEVRDATRKRVEAKKG